MCRRRWKSIVRGIPAASWRLRWPIRVCKQTIGVRMPRFAIPLLVCAMASAIGCNAPEKPATAEARPQPTVPADVQMAADMLLGKGSEVLAVGDLAQNGHRQA